MKISAREARERFSELFARAARGEEIVILRRGKPVARLGRAEADKPRGKLPDLSEFGALSCQGSLTETLLAERERRAADVYIDTSVLRRTTVRRPHRRRRRSCCLPARGR
jgi:prevent-host-death family protein